MNKLKVLVTGCGGDIGQSIGKILKTRSDLFSVVIGADLHLDHAGKFIFDQCLVISKCDSQDYQKMVFEIIQDHSIDIVIPISEPELRKITLKNYQDNYFGKPVIIANQLAREIGFDKKATAEFLFSNHLPFPKTYLISEYDKGIFPVLIKSRTGSGSKSIHLVNNGEEISRFKYIYPDFIVQEYLNGADGEFTCGLFRSNKGEIRDIIFNRKLMGGFSGFGIRQNHPIISEFLNQLATVLCLRGSINIQLRVVNNQPIVFEINPRFSSTVLFRHLMGFEDLIWSIQDKLDLPLSTCTINQSITNFYKGFTEYVD
jgi:carbamoyl-phosphate synthase large subunit